MSVKNRLKEIRMKEYMLNMKAFESLNLIKYENGYSKFISKLPKPLD